MNMEIDTYANVDSLYYVMQGVASFMGSGTWTGLIKYTLLCGLVIWTVAAIGRKGTEIIRWFAGAMLMTQLLLLPVENVFITDVNNVQPTREVDHVPVYLAAVAQSATLISRVMTEAYETVFSVPDTLTLKKGDVGFGVSVLKKVNQAEITDPGLHADLMQFFKECTVYDIQDGAIDPKTIMSGTDPFNTVFTSTSPARYVTTNTLTANPTTDTCSATGTLLLIRVQDAEQTAEQIYGSEMYPEITDASLAKSEFVNAIGDSYGFILQSSQNASSALRQAMFNNVWRQAGAELPAMLNDPARVNEVNALMSSAQAAVATNGSLSSMAILAKDTLPTVRNYAEAIIYAVFPIILVLCLISGGEGAKRILGAYAKTVGWVALWPMMFAVINGLSLMHLSHEMRSMSLQAGVPFGMAAKFGKTLIDEQALLGYMVLLAPAFAWGLLNMATAGVTGAFSMLNDAVTGGARQIGAQQAQGDESIGSVHMDSSSVDTASRNVTSANKWDTTVQSRTGSMSVETGNGTAYTNFANGLIARSDFQNSLGVSAMSQDAVERSLGTDSSTGIAANRTNSTFGGHETVAAGTITTANSQDRSQTQRFGDEANSSIRGSISKSGERRASNDQQYGVDQGHATELQTSVGGRVSGMLGGSFEKSFGDDGAVAPGVGSGGGNNAPGKNAGGGRSPGNNPVANSPFFNQGEEDKLARKAESLGKSPQEVQAVRDAYRNKVQAVDYANGGGTGKGKSNFKLGLDLSGEGGVTKSWRNIEAQKFVDQYSTIGSYGENDQFSREGGQNHVDATGTESGQHVRNDHSASLTDQTLSGSRNSADLSRSTDLRQRGSTQTVSRVDTSTNLMTPENLRAVAARNGMRYSQLMTLSEPDLARLVKDDASMRDLVVHNATLPSIARDGSALPGNQRDVVRQNQRNQGSVGANAAGAYQRYTGAVGPVDTTPLDVRTPLPQVVDDAQQRVDVMKQRVAEDSVSPIKQVRDNVDPSAANKPLMTPERAPGRPLPNSPASAPTQPAKTPLDAWKNDLSIPRNGGAASEVSSASPTRGVAPLAPSSVDKFLHPDAPGKGPTLAAAQATGRQVPAAAVAPERAHLNESEFKVVELDPKGATRTSSDQVVRPTPPNQAESKVTAPPKPARVSEAKAASTPGDAASVSGKNTPAPDAPTTPRATAVSFDLPAVQNGIASAAPQALAAADGPTTPSTLISMRQLGPRVGEGSRAVSSAPSLPGENHDQE